jgi:hypothetical protein
MHSWWTTFPVVGQKDKPLPSKPPIIRRRGSPLAHTESQTTLWRHHVLLFPPTPTPRARKTRRVDLASTTRTSNSSAPSLQRNHFPSPSLACQISLVPPPPLQAPTSYSTCITCLPLPPLLPTAGKCHPIRYRSRHRQTLLTGEEEESRVRSRSPSKPALGYGALGVAGGVGH